MRLTFLPRLIKIICFVLLCALQSSFTFAKNNKNWKSWNVTYYDYTDEDSHDIVFNVFVKKISNIEQAKRFQGTKNPLIREVKGIDTLYEIALRVWLDYIKFALCDADGLQNLTDEEIALYNEIFPSLDIFAKDFFTGVYTNSIDPEEFSFTPKQLKGCYKIVQESLEQMSRHIDIEHYLDHPSDIPELSRTSKKRTGGLGFIVFWLFILGIIFIAYLKRDLLMKNQKIASIIANVRTSKLILNIKENEKIKSAIAKIREIKIFNKKEENE